MIVLMSALCTLVNLSQGNPTLSLSYLTGTAKIDTNLVKALDCREYPRKLPK